MCLHIMNAFGKNRLIISSGLMSLRNRPGTIQYWNESIFKPPVCGNNTVIILHFIYAPIFMFICSIALRHNEISFLCVCENRLWCAAQLAFRELQWSLNIMDCILYYGNAIRLLIARKYLQMNNSPKMYPVQYSTKLLLFIIYVLYINKQSGGIFFWHIIMAKCAQLKSDAVYP